MPNDIYHHGTKGQKWYNRRYQNPDGSLTPLGRIHYGIKGTRVKKRDDTRPKSEPSTNVNKKQNVNNVNVEKENTDVKKENPIADDLADRWSKRKQRKYVDAIRSGNKRKIRRAEKHLTNDELREAIDRIDLNYKLDNMKKQNKSENLRRAKDNVQNAAMLAGQAVNIWNVAAGISETTDRLPTLPKIDVKAKDPLDRRKKEIALETEILKKKKAEMEYEEIEADHDTVMEEKDRNSQRLRKQWERENSNSDSRRSTNTNNTPNQEREQTTSSKTKPSRSYQPWETDGLTPDFKTNTDWDKPVGNDWEENVKEEVRDHLGRLGKKYDKTSHQEAINRATKNGEELADMESALNGQLRDLNKKSKIMNITDDEIAEFKRDYAAKKAEMNTNRAIAELYGQTEHKDQSYNSYLRDIKKQNKQIDSKYESDIEEYNKTLNEDKERIRRARDNVTIAQRALRNAKDGSTEQSYARAAAEEAQSALAQAISFEKNTMANKPIKPDKKDPLSKSEFEADKVKKYKGLLDEIDTNRKISSQRKSVNGKSNLSLFKEILRAYQNYGSISEGDVSKEAYEYYVQHKMWNDDLDNLDDLLQSMFSVNIYEALER